MELLTDELREKLTSAFADETRDHAPIIKLFCPWGSATWLLTGIDGDDNLFGLCDLGLGFPELGYVTLRELKEIKGPFGMTIERDLYFRPKASLLVYAQAARINEAITDDAKALRQAFAGLEARARAEKRKLLAFMID